MKIMRQLKRIIVVVIIIILTIVASQIASTWWEYNWLRKTETITVDPWIKKHWNHVKIITDVLNNMQSSRTILLWTTFFGISDYVPKFTSLGCPVPNCFITSNRDYLNKSNALIFHLRDMNLEDMPSVRSPKQIWILLHHESPPHTPDTLKHLSGVFNWTATYRYDSEISLSPIVEKRNDVIETTNYAKGKKKMVAWLVSNCKTPSKREDFVMELQKSIPVDIYGTCGQLSCMPKMSDQCYEKLSAMYWYYLSFENSICKDYATEKFFRILNTNMVPVVLGGANYSSIAPPNSYIDALSFKTPKDLAYFLLQVAKDNKKYNSFFTWKKTHRLIYEHYACEICRKLHKPVKYSVYVNISNWWFHDANCKSWTPL